ncbi:MAG: response regulator transcription factor [Ferruginibacter sp.]
MPNLLLIDDHTIVRSGMKMIIENFLPHCNIDEAEDGDAAFEKIKQNDYDLLILDINMPGTDTLDLISKILALKPGSKILMLSMNSEEIYAKRYLNAGAMGYVRKDSPEQEIKKAVTNVLANKKYISEALAEKLTNELNIRHNSDNPFDRLSPREIQIVHHLVCGDSLSEISRILVLKSSTVGTHKARIFEKLYCSNIIDLSTLAKLHNVMNTS